MNTIKMFWMMLVSLRHYFKVEDKEAFWDEYWEQIPDARYPNETLWETWETFKHYITAHLWQERLFH